MAQRFFFVRAARFWMIIFFRSPKMGRQNLAIIIPPESVSRRLA